MFEQLKLTFFQLQKSIKDPVVRNFLESKYFDKSIKYLRVGIQKHMYDIDMEI